MSIPVPENRVLPRSFVTITVALTGPARPYGAPNDELVKDAVTFGGNLQLSTLGARLHQEAEQLVAQFAADLDPVIKTYFKK
jgi:hypothetical protein